jgi:hypothetical protein
LIDLFRRQSKSRQEFDQYPDDYLTHGWLKWDATVNVQSLEKSLNRFEQVAERIVACRDIFDRLRHLDIIRDPQVGKEEATHREKNTNASEYSCRRWKQLQKNTRDERLQILSANGTHQTDTVAKDSIGGKRMQHVDHTLEAPHRLSAIASKSTEVLRLLCKSISDGFDRVACFEFLGKWMLGEACPCLPLKLLESSVEKRLNNGLPWRVTHVPDQRNTAGKRRIALLRTERLGRREW